MKVLGSHDVVNIPADQGACPACGGGLFAVVRTYFADTGEPVEDNIYVGCVDCDVEVGGPSAKALRHWVSSNYRVKI
jgi:hypothetical protein